MWGGDLTPTPCGLSIFPQDTADPTKVNQGLPLLHMGLSRGIKEINVGPEVLCSRMTLLGNHFVIIKYDSKNTVYKIIVLNHFESFKFIFK